MSLEISEVNSEVSLQQCMYQFLYSLEKQVLWEERLWKINHYINLYVHCQDATDVTVQ